MKNIWYDYNIMAEKQKNRRLIIDVDGIFTKMTAKELDKKTNKNNLDYLKWRNYKILWKEELN